MKTIALYLSVGALAAVLAGCSNSHTDPPAPSGTLTGGNWLVMPRSDENLGALDGHLRGLATIEGGAISMKLQMTASGSESGMCVPQGSPVTFTGTVNGSAVQISWANSLGGQGENGAITAVVNPDNSVLGTYKSSGLCTDLGSIYGTRVPSIGGSWSGTLYGTDLVSNNADHATLAATLTQADAPSSANSGPAEALPLSGTVTVNSATCTGSAPVKLTVDNTQSYITGELVSLVAVSADQQTVLSWYAALSDPTTAIAMSYSSFQGSNSSLTSSTCDLDFTSTATIAKN